MSGTQVTQAPAQPDLGVQAPSVSSLIPRGWVLGTPPDPDLFLPLGGAARPCQRSPAAWPRKLPRPALRGAGRQSSPEEERTGALAQHVVRENITKFPGHVAHKLQHRIAPLGMKLGLKPLTGTRRPLPPQGHPPLTSLSASLPSSCLTPGPSAGSFALLSSPASSSAWKVLGAPAPSQAPSHWPGITKGSVGVSPAQPLTPPHRGPGCPLVHQTPPLGHT